MHTIQSDYKKPVPSLPLIYDAEVFKASAPTKSNFEKSGLEASRLHCTRNNHRAFKV